MSPDKLYGTLTSPFVRRVRVAALEMGIAFEFCDTASEAGQRELRQIAPLWKVPVAQLEGGYLYDSEVILSALSRRCQQQSCLGPWPEDTAEQNVKTVLDGAVDALVNVVLLGRDGLAPEQVPYLAKQRDRAAAALRWVDDRVVPMGLASPARFSWLELSLVTALEWMVYRNAFDVDSCAGLSASLRAHQSRSSLVQTRPPPGAR